LASQEHKDHGEKQVLQGRLVGRVIPVLLDNRDLTDNQDNQEPKENGVQLGEWEQLDKLEALEIQDNKDLWELPVQ
jgi:hypothetical protein